MSSTSTNVTPYTVKKQTCGMKLVLTKDTRAVPKPSPAPNKTSTTPAYKSVITDHRIAPASKQDSLSPTDKPIEMPSVPKLIPILGSPKTHLNLDHFFVPKSSPSATSTGSSPHTHSKQVHILKKLSSPTHKLKLDELIKRKNPVKKTAPPLIERDKSDEQPPKPKKVKTTTSAGLPMNRVKTIMKTDIQSHQNSLNISQDSLAVVTKATELFIAELARRSCNTAREQAAKSVTYGHLASSVQKNKDVRFLHAVLPNKVLAKDYIPSPNETSTNSDHTIV